MSNTRPHHNPPPHNTSVFTGVLLLARPSHTHELPNTVATGHPPTRQNRQGTWAGDMVTGDMVTPTNTPKPPSWGPQVGIFWSMSRISPVWWVSPFRSLLVDVLKSAPTASWTPMTSCSSSPPGAPARNHHHNPPPHSSSVFTGVLLFARFPAHAPIPSPYLVRCCNRPTTDQCAHGDPALKVHHQLAGSIHSNNFPWFSSWGG